jgi:hypothetical protein
METLTLLCKQWSIACQQSMWMRLTTISIVLGVILFTAVSTSASAAPKLRSRDLALARDYVFAACVIERYPNTPLATEADAWATGLVEQGGLAPDAYSALARFAHTAPESSITRNGMVMRLQSCIDFINAQGFSVHLQSVLRH